MVEIKDFDADSYELEFEEDTLEAERKFYVQHYPNVNMVADRRLHCTTCDTHIGCAVANEQTIRMHPVLRVTHCKKCHTFYNSGEFSKGEDGSELYCRWCGQGGEVYCCSKCPYVFCKKCILQNLSKSVITEIESNDDWQCFRCAPTVMWPLRAQHWALVNYIEKTKKRILREEKDDEQIYELMNKDPTLCCKEKKSQKTRRAAKSKRRRRHSSTTDSDCSTPEPKRIADHSAVLPKMVTSTPQQKTKKQLDELVCTPDILSMFSDAAEEQTVSAPSSRTASKTSTISSTVSQKSAASQPPPLIIRQLPASSSVQTVRFPNRQFAVTAPRVAAPPPAYYTVNGYRVDLNQAAQQDTYRLPNGKLIQVKKQTAANQLSGASNRNVATLQPRSNSTNPNPYSIRFNIQPTQQAPPVQIQQHVAPAAAAPQPSAAQALHQQHLQQQQQILNGLSSSVPMTVPVVSVQTPQQMLNRFPGTPVGKAQTELEKQIHGAQEICQQIVGKCNTLMKSNAYKSVRTFNDVKELHLHLSYLFTYTIDKFTTLQTKCTDAMKSLTNAHEAANKLADKKNKYTNVDDDLEVVEPTTVCIEIDSDDEAEPRRSAPVQATTDKPRPKQPRKTTHQPKSNAVINISEEVPIEIVDTIDNDDLELPTPPPLDSEDESHDRENDETVRAVPAEKESDDRENDGKSKDLSTEDESYDRENDEKLKALPKVVLEKDEEVERKLKEILERRTSENGTTSPVNDESDVQMNDSDAHVNDAMDTSENATEESASETNAAAVHTSEDNGDKEDSEVVAVDDSEVSKDDSAVDKADNDVEMTDDEVVEEDKIDDKVGTDDEATKGDKSDKIEDTDTVESNELEHEKDETVEKTEKTDDRDKGEIEDKGDDLTNGRNNDEDEPMVDCPLNSTDLSCPGSPALTDNLENDLLDELDHQNNLTDNSFENISSPDMFDDMSKNGFDKATENIVTLSTENADPDLV